MKAHHSSGVGYLETVENGDIVKRPGVNEKIHIINPRQDGSGISFTAGVDVGAPGRQFHSVHWHRHTLIMPAE